MTCATDMTIAAAALNRGAPALLPTETVWGLAARLDRADGIAAIYALKGRDDSKPLAVCVRDAEAANALAVLSDAAKALAAAHWPGPLTLVVPVQDAAAIHHSAQSDGTIGLRCPDVFWRDALCDRPLVLTSANRSGEPPTTTEAQARSAFPGTACLPDPHPSAPSAPTTVAKVVGDSVEILRQGELTLAQLTRDIPA